MAHEIMGKVEQVNALLKAGEPENVSEDTYGGYTGYKPQYILDALNTVFGIGGWGFKELSSEVLGSLGEKATGLVITQVEVWIQGIDFHPTGWGQGRITKGDVGDARKSGQTDAIKKTLSYFSIGNRAYQGLLTTGEKGKQNGNAQSPRQPQQRPQAQHAKQNITPLPPKPAEIVTSTQLNNLYLAGKDKGLWSASAMNKFYAFVSGALDGMAINAESIKQLTYAQYQAVVASYEQEQAQAS